MEARISIIIPCYKAKATLERCLDSLRRQSVPIECLLVEDCSNDGTLEVAQKYFDAHSELAHKIVRHETNKGVATSRNDGLKNATGEYVMFVDADDELDSNCCQRLLEMADPRHADIVCCNIMHVYADGRTRPYTTFMPGFSEFNGHDYLLKRHFNAMMDPCWGKIYKRSFLESKQLFFVSGMSFGEDTLFVNRAVLCSSLTVVASGYFGYFYHDNSNSCVNTITLQRRLDNLQLLLEELKKHLPEKEDAILLRKCAEYLWSIRKFAGKERNAIVEKTCHSPIWSSTLYPVIKRHGKPRHKLVAWFLSIGCKWAIAFW